MMNYLAMMDPRRREQALTALALSPETQLGGEQRLAAKREAIRSKDGAALRKILEQEKIEINQLLSGYAS